MNLSDLKPAPFNPRQIDEPSLSALAVSMRQFGDISGLVWNKRNGLLVCGHQRLKALKHPDVISKAGRHWLVGSETDEQFPIRVVDWDEPTHKAAMVAANSEKLMGTWMQESLDTIVEEVQTLEVADGLRLEELATPVEPEIVEDDVPEAPDEPATRPGDLWVMGGHRVLCGDATKAEDYSLVLAGAVPNAILTDPPYGVGVKYESFPDDEESVRTLISTFMPMLLRFDRPLGLTSGHRAMWFYPRPTWVMAWIHPAGMGRNPWGFTQFNPVLVYGSCPYLARGLGSRPDSIVMATDRQGVDGHPTPKPMKVWCWLLERFSPSTHELILDPFLGSGTTLIAAHQLDRRCFGIEIEPRYVDVACRRWMGLTNESPVRESDGAKFSDLTATEPDAN